MAKRDGESGDLAAKEGAPPPHIAPARRLKRSALTGQWLYYPASEPDNITIEQAREAVRRVLAEDA